VRSRVAVKYLEELSIPSLRVLRLPVGPIQANSYIAYRQGGPEALVIDPGDEPARIGGELEARALTPLAILVTHGHFDHVGGVSELARSTGARVYMSADEAPMLAQVADYTPPGFGPYEACDPDVLLAGGEQLEIGPFAVEVLRVPGHSPAHLAYLVDGALFSGDVLFAGSVGRTDLPGGDWDTLAASLMLLHERLPAETRVLSGHGPETTLGQEARTNPYLAPLVHAAT
jgi:glyoxylase-like metal-dependent hydrolase (beta-lactamase superfamily II)